MPVISRLPQGGGSGNAVASDLLSGKTASTDAGDITGTMINRTGTQSTASGVGTPSGGTIPVYPAQGYYDGSSAVSNINDSNFISSNIISGKSIFGVNGSAKRMATGRFMPTSATQVLTISGLAFKPRVIYCFCSFDNGIAGLAWSSDDTTQKRAGKQSNNNYVFDMSSYTSTPLIVTFNNDGVTFDPQFRQFWLVDYYNYDFIAIE